MEHMKSPAKKKDVGLDIDKLQNLSECTASKFSVLKRQIAAEQSSSRHTIFQPQNSNFWKRASGNPSSISPKTHGPEKKLTLFALRLAVLEKAAIGLGALGSVWATVVLIGGAAADLHESDFWCITTILLIESTRLFSGSHELEWHNQATWTITRAGTNGFLSLVSNSSAFIRYLKGVLRSFVKIERLNQQDVGNRTYCRSEQPESIDSSMVMTQADVSKNVSKVLYWIQLLSATSCIVLSLCMLTKQDYGIEKGDSEKDNLLHSLIIFYSLALAEGLLFLVEKAYWEWQVSYCNLLEEVSKECKLGPTGFISVQRFFYDAYARCIYGSNFDGLKMDMVTFAMKLLDSISSDEQLIAARILRQFVLNEVYAMDTLQKVGIDIGVIERLVEILNWRSPQQEEIRESAAVILLKLAGREQNSLRVAEIPGAIESISSLLQNTRSLGEGADEIGDNKITYDDDSNYDVWKFNNLGLVILKRLARHPDNCAKIGNTRGLLPKIIDFTYAEEQLLKEEKPALPQIQTVKRALRLLKMLTSTTGAKGEYLRHKISEIIFTISNMRDILHHGKKHPKMLKYSIQILTFLALENDATEKIGGTGGTLNELFNIFFKIEVPVSRDDLQTTAGEALAMLTLESRSNCHRILKFQVLKMLVEALEVPLLRVNAARILRNLCTYTSSELYHQLEGVKSSASMVLKAILSEESKLQEVMIGLAAYVFKFMSLEESSNMFKRAKIGENELVEQLVHVLEKYQKPATKVPRIRRFSIELAIWMMEQNAKNVKTFKDLGVGKELNNILETMDEVENFDIFFGTIGVTRHLTKMQALVEEAAKMLES